jgi:hypothetical protein
MHPLSIIIAFGFLGMLMAVGALLVVIGTGRLRLRHSPSPGFDYEGSPPTRGQSALALNVLLLALGLLLIFLGSYGTYNLIWAT